MPSFGRRNIEIKNHREFTGGGCASSHDKFTCLTSGNRWKSEEQTEYI